MTTRPGRSRRAPVRQRGASPTQTPDLYVYALMDGPIRPRRLSGRWISVIEVAGVHAAVERLTAPPELSEAALRLQHEIVVRLGLASDAILPVRFGAFVSAEELERVVRLRRGTLRAALDEVRGREQMTVRILGRAEPRVSGVDARTGTTYLMSRAASHRVPESSAATAISIAVRPMVAASRTDPGRGAVQLVLNHLIDRGHAEQYRSLMESVVAALEPAPQLIISGPWPPFAFVPDLWSPEPVVSGEDA